MITKIKQIFSILIFFLFLLLVVEIYYLNRGAINTTVLIQAGHAGRTKGSTGSSNGEYREVDWNVKIAKEVEKRLKDEGVEVTRVGADIPKANTRLAIAIHFDGSENPCSTGASIGYQERHYQAKETALRWKKIYEDYFPFGWHKDNFTKNLSDYYGFSKVKSEKGFLVMELGEISCDEQVKWIEPRLEKIATKIANFIVDEL